MIQRTAVTPAIKDGPRRIQRKMMGLVQVSRQCLNLMASQMDQNTTVLALTMETRRFMLRMRTTQELVAIPLVAIDRIPRNQPLLEHTAKMPVNSSC